MKIPFVNLLFIYDREIYFIKFIDMMCNITNIIAINEISLNYLFYNSDTHKILQVQKT